jgi:hypothetical protein
LRIEFPVWQSPVDWLAAVSEVRVHRHARSVEDAIGFPVFPAIAVATKASIKTPDSRKS